MMITVKNLIENFGIVRHKTHKLMRLMVTAKIPSVWVAPQISIDDAMDHANELLDGFGVEPVRTDTYVDDFWGDIIALYVNLGDPYDTTILYDTDRDEFFIGSWGDFLEEWEMEELESEEPEEPAWRRWMP